MGAESGGKAAAGVVGVALGCDWLQLLSQSLQEVSEEIDVHPKVAVGQDCAIYNYLFGGLPLPLR